MSIADRGLWIIERNWQQPLSLEGIAKACGVSRSHLAYAFGTATGLSVMKYLRGRRLSEAARQLADGAPDILSLALEAGYSSHEAFTRAFRDQFATTPESVRDSHSLNGIALVEPLKLQETGEGQVAAPYVAGEDTVLIVGLAQQCSFETTLRIPAQWQRFMPFYAAIPAKLDRIPTGVSYASDDEGHFQYVCGAEVSRFGDTLSELIKLEIPPRTYAVFEHLGHVSGLTETYRTIWNQSLPALGRAVANAPILERHNPTFDPRTGEGDIKLWIPLAG